MSYIRTTGAKRTALRTRKVEKMARVARSKKYLSMRHEKKTLERKRETAKISVTKGGEVTERQ